MYSSHIDTYGCFSKTSSEGLTKVFWGTGGTNHQKGKTNLSGTKERVWCDDTWNDEGWKDDGRKRYGGGAPSDPFPTWAPTLLPTKEPSWNDDGWTEYCLTQADCNMARHFQGYVHFHPGHYNAYGCFTKGGRAYWGIGGTEEQMKKEFGGNKRERSKLFLCCVLDSFFALLWLFFCVCSYYCLFFSSYTSCVL